MEELFDNLKYQALECGVNVFTFWNMTYGEIVDVIKTSNKMKLAKLKEKANLDHALAELIGLSVSRLLDKNAKYPTLFEAYPELFKEESEKKKLEEPIQQDWEIAKARLMAYATNHNKKRGEEDKRRGVKDIN